MKEVWGKTCRCQVAPFLSTVVLNNVDTDVGRRNATVLRRPDVYCLVRIRISTPLHKGRELLENHKA